MKTMSNYLIIMLLVMLFIFRLVVVFTTVLGVEFTVQSINVKLEIVLLLVMIISIILISRNKISGTILLLIASIAYYGPDLFNKFVNASSSSLSIENVTQIIASLICIVIPIFAFFIIAFAKQQEKKPVDKKTDFFYKNEAYDRKYDDRADKNNYRTL